MKDTEQASFYVGPNVEHSPAYSKKTLFVVGKQDSNKIINLARENKATHIFLGANHSFDFDPTDNTRYWDSTITALLDRGFWVTLNYPAHQHESILKMLNQFIWLSRLFVPLLSIRIPKLQTSNGNLSVKFDDDFKGSNPGVWCMHFHQVTDSNRFTDWIEYSTDLIIEEVVEDIQPRPGLKADVERRPLSEENSIDLKSLKPLDDVKNDEAAGLDPDAKSMLKGESEQILEKLDISALDAAEAYAGKEPTIKKGKK
jgi:hypothetical protein